MIVEVWFTNNAQLLAESFFYRKTAGPESTFVLFTLIPIHL